MSKDTAVTERNLLFGILALQNGFVDREALLDAFNRWVLDKTRPLGQFLLDRGDLRADERALLDALVAKHLEKFGNHPEKSLNALSSLGSARRVLEQVADPGLQASLAHVSAARVVADDPYATVNVASVDAQSIAGSRFRILRPHAKGGLGQVSIALDQELDRPVALKEIQERHADDPQRRARFVEEAEITGKLEHPGIIPVYGLGHDVSGRPFYAMRFIHGDNLKEAIGRFRAGVAQGHNPEQRAVGLRSLLRRFTDVCNAIAYAHSRGVLHRDLKPGNIMLGPYGETLVVDWGLAKALSTTTDAVPEPGSSPASAVPPMLPEGPIRLSGQSRSRSDTVAGSPIGTPAYASPEQAAGRLDLLGQASDVYGLGAILYSILTGEPPVRDSDMVAVLRRVELGEIAPPRSLDPTIPRPLEAICRKAMALRPNDRYPSARALANEIERWLDDLPVSSYREPLHVRARRWIQNHRTTAAALSSALLVALFGIGIFLWSMQRADQADQRRAQGLSLKILTDEVGNVSSSVETMGPIASRVGAILATSWRDPALDPVAKLRVAIVLAPTDSEVRKYLVDRLLESEPKTVRVIAEALKKMDSQSAIQRFWGLVEDATSPPAPRFRAACALAVLDPPGAADESRWARQVDWLVREALNAAFFPSDEFDRTLSPLDGLYLGAVARRCLADDPRQTAALKLLQIHTDRARQTDPIFFSKARPTALILDTEPDNFDWLLKVIEQNRDQSIADLTLAAENPDVLFVGWESPNEIQRSRRRAHALITLARLGRIDACWPVFRRFEDPGLRAWLSRDLSRYGVAPKSLIQQLGNETDPSGRTALLLVLGGFDPRRIEEPFRRDVEKLLLDWYRNDRDPGVHGAVSWLLGEKWARKSQLRDIDQGRRSRDPAPGRDWFVNGQGQTFSVVRGPTKFLMGSPPAPGMVAAAPNEQEEEDNSERQHERLIPRSFAIATTEVTVAQYREFVNDNKAIFPNGLKYKPKFSPQEDCPIHGVMWFQALIYCRWLSEKEKVGEDQQCLPPIAEMMDSLNEGKLKMKSGYAKRTGYRLPTEAEWEFTCRAGTATPRHFGCSVLLLPEYGWVAGNCDALTPANSEIEGRTHRVGLLKPNGLGLFDVYGNVREWCLDLFEPYPKEPQFVHVDGLVDAGTADDNRITRGGSFVDPPDWTRSAYRSGALAVSTVASTGFRVVRTIP
jgi:formylglycine-generating enzyme required for sulfatase activity/serine/threonine protein kinase